MKLPVIVPAFNEERLLSGTLEHVGAGIRVFEAQGWSTELIVCDNNSSDRTADIARAAGARVVFEPVNQIARARNTGARAACGDWLLFVDADSSPSPELFRAVLEEIEGGRCVGGGSTIDTANVRTASRRAVKSASAVPVDDPSPGQVVWRKLHGDSVSREDSDVMLSHPSGDVAEDAVTVVQIDPKHGVGKGLGHRSFHLEGCFLLRARPLHPFGPLLGGLRRPRRPRSRSGTPASCHVSLSPLSGSCLARDVRPRSKR
jgi:glycosyltransferase involved in cell wall biosynthesis